MTQVNDKLIYLDDLKCESDRHPHVTVARLSDVMRIDAFKTPRYGMRYTITLRPGHIEDDTYRVDKVLWEFVRDLLTEAVNSSVGFLGRTADRIGEFLEETSDA